MLWVSKMFEPRVSVRAVRGRLAVPVAPPSRLMLVTGCSQYVAAGTRALMFSLLVLPELRSRAFGLGYESSVRSLWGSLESADVRKRGLPFLGFAVCCCPLCGELWVGHRVSRFIFSVRSMPGSTCLALAVLFCVFGRGPHGLFAFSAVAFTVSCASPHGAAQGRS